LLGTNDGPGNNSLLRRILDANDSSFSSVCPGERGGPGRFVIEGDQSLSILLGSGAW
jgi:hypothetical protein